MNKAGLTTGEEAVAKPRPAAAAVAETSNRPRDARQARMGQAFAQVVAVLMRDPSYRNMKLADLEWLVLPPVLAGQFRLGHAAKQPEPGQERPGGPFVPVAVALWASVSKQIDSRLSENLDKPVRLRAEEWATGEHVWLMAIAGDQRAVPHFLEQLAATQFKGKQVKMRRRGPDGRVEIKTINPSA